MTALEPAHRVLLAGIIFGACICAAIPSAALIVVSPAPAVIGTALLHGDRGGSEASLQYVHWGRFCRWYRQHRLCLQLVKLRRFCDRHRNFRLCDDDDEDRFCRRHPYHRRCDDKPPSPS